MSKTYDMKSMAAKITALRKNAEELKEIAGDFPTVIKNADRILADVRMLEINVNEVADLPGK